MSESIGSRNFEPRAALDELIEPVGVRVPWNAYLTLYFLGTYACALFLYLEKDWLAIPIFALSWVLVPFLALSDHIVFDGKRIYRTGWPANLWAWARANRRRLKVSDIEQIDTQATRMIRRGGRIVYRYRTAIHGRGQTFVLTSSGENYRAMISAILPRVADEALDARTIELRDHLIDPKEVQMKAAFAGIPRADVLRAGVLARTGKRIRANESELDIAPTEGDKGVYLHRLGNELRVAGYLTQAMESFRRALLLRPRDAHLLYDFARCLQSFAGAERNERLNVRSIAALRLAERYAETDASLLARIGETYVQVGEWRRGVNAFQKALDRVGDTFLAARGMAEAALRDGKIAHVIHQFMTANRAASTPSLRRWTRGEADYFSNLNSDDEYMEMEVGRVNLLESIERTKRTVLRIASAGFLPLMFGLMVDDTIIADIGWAVTTIALVIWSGTMIVSRMLASRIPYDAMPSED